jgi:hypothetical protein
MVKEGKAELKALGDAIRARRAKLGVSQEDLPSYATCTGLTFVAQSAQSWRGELLVKAQSLAAARFLVFLGRLIVISDDIKRVATV